MIEIDNQEQKIGAADEVIFINFYFINVRFSNSFIFNFVALYL